MTDVLPGTVTPATEAQYRDVPLLYVLPRIGTKRLATLSPSDVDEGVATCPAHRDATGRIQPNGPAPCTVRAGRCSRGRPRYA